MPEPSARRNRPQHQARGLPVRLGCGDGSGTGLSSGPPKNQNHVETITQPSVSDSCCFSTPPCCFLLQTSVMSPGDVVKVRLQCQTESRRATGDARRPRYRGPAHCLLSIIKEDGVAGLYRGALPLMLRDGPSYALYFLTYSTACEYLTDSGQTKPSESGRLIKLCGCVFFLINYYFYG